MFVGYVAMLGCFCRQGGLVHLNTANSTGKRCKKQRDFMTQNFETQPWHPGYDLLFNQCQYDHQRTWTFGSQARGPIFQLTAYSRSRKIIPMMTLIKSGGSQNLVTRLYEESSFKHDVGTCNIWFGVFFLLTHNMCGWWFRVLGTKHGDCGVLTKFTWWVPLLPPDNTSIASTSKEF